MRWLHKLIKNKPDIAISIPAVLCFIQFITDIIDVFKSGAISNAMLNQLVSSANGFEAMCLFIIMLALRDKHK